MNEHDHKLDIACLTCIRNIIFERDLLWEFVNSISEHFNLSESNKEFIDFYVVKEKEAFELLKKLGL